MCVENNSTIKLKVHGGLGICFFFLWEKIRTFVNCKTFSRQQCMLLLLLGLTQTKYFTQRLPLVDQELLTLPMHPSCPPPTFRADRVAWSLVFYVVLCRSLFVLLSFFLWPLHFLYFFDLRFLIYVFWLPLWYLRFTSSGYLFGILDLRLLVTSLVS
jgi:hypothetical protein